MAKLADFPPEIFEAIFSFEGTSAGVIALWKCGNKHLNWLISRGCSDIDLLDTKWQSESVFPKLLLELHSLRSLRIKRGTNHLVGAKSLGLLLQNLSPTLEKLALECIEAETCFLVSPPSDSATNKLPADYAPMSIQKAGPCPKQSQFWDVSNIFPNLQSLTLSAESSFLTDVELPFLPPSLTELRLLMMKWPNPSLLPPQLETLSLLVLGGLSGEYLEKLPRSLRNIHATLNIQRDADWALLPPTLETADICDVILSATNAPYLQPLPLKELHQVSLSLEDSQNAPWVSLLPSTLTHLDFSSSEFPISSSVLKSLPRGITSLLLKTIVGQDLEEDQNVFPPKLACLMLHDLPKAKETREKLMRCIPRTLTTFYTEEMGEDLEIFELLPPSVTFCSLTSYSACKAPHVTLPQSIRTLEMFVDWADEKPLVEFPRNLTSISLRQFPSLEPLKSLPESLISLHISRDIDAEMLDILPSGLQSISLTIKGEVNPTNFERFTSLKDFSLRSEEREATYFRGAFPASLRSLTMKKVVEASQLRQLPDALQNLIIQIDSELTNEIIQQLPRSLRSLRLDVRGWTSVSDDAWQWFPPHLDPRISNIQDMFNPSRRLPALSHR